MMGNEEGKKIEPSPFPFCLSISLYTVFTALAYWSDKNKEGYL
jgi:hypothetical protein